jgi:hypothetical protein
MRSFSKSSALLALLLAAGCAHSETLAVVLDSRGRITDREETRRGLAVSCSQDYELSDASTKLLNVTVENRSRLAQNLTAIRFSVAPVLAKSVDVPTGVELKGWVEALKAKQALQEERAAWILAGLSLGATPATAKFPENHLLTAPVTVPPQLFLRRFLIIHLKEGVSPRERFFLTFQYEEGPSETLGLPLSCEEPPTDKRNASFL